MFFLLHLHYIVKSGFPFRMVIIIEEDKVLGDGSEHINYYVRIICIPSERIKMQGTYAKKNTSIML